MGVGGLNSETQPTWKPKPARHAQPGPVPFGLPASTLYPLSLSFSWLQDGAAGAMALSLGVSLPNHFLGLWASANLRGSVNPERGYSEWPLLRKV